MVLAVLQNVYATFWDPVYWLPKAINWETFQSGNGSIRYPQSADMFYPVVMGFGMLFLRLVLECFLFLPVGYYSGLFTKFIPSDQTLTQVIWSHLTGGFAQQTKTKKVLESAWLLWFYTTAFGIGLFVMADKKWLWNVNECWIDYPHHSVGEDIRWFYLFQASFYWSSMISAATDTRRKDFWMMMIHHAVSSLLLFISWTINFVRVGTLLLLSHDLSDVLLNIGKVIKYSDLPPIYVNVVFVVFMATWLATRLGYFPAVLLRSALLDAPEIVQRSYRWENFTQPPHVPRIIIGMLVVLLVLHVVWTYIILKIAVVTATKGAAEDVRSESEEEEEEEKVKSKKKQ